ncbi:MAG: hypothetical protein IJM64_06135 [Ottowia sp.]|nr:hypothetical protein [Ottowia sp.]
MAAEQSVKPRSIRKISAALLTTRRKSAEQQQNCEGSGGENSAERGKNEGYQHTAGNISRQWMVHRVGML